MMVTIDCPLIAQNPEIVATFIKKNLLSSIEHHHRRHHHHHHRSHYYYRRHYFHNRKRSNTPKATSTSVIASINKSAVACRRRLIKFLSTLRTCVFTTKSRQSDYNEIPKQQKLQLKHESEPRTDFNIGYRIMPEAPCLLPPLGHKKKRTIVLDLDETLIHASVDSAPRSYDFVVSPIVGGQTINMYVLKRPMVDEFLKEISQKYEVVVFTAGLKEYASLALDKLDPSGLISHRLYRNSCRMVQGRLVKDLSHIGRDLRNVVIVDDNPNSYALQPENAIPIKQFKDDNQDKELQKVAGFLKRCDGYEDMRDAVKKFLVGNGQCQAIWKPSN